MNGSARRLALGLALALVTGRVVVADPAPVAGEALPGQLPQSAPAVPPTQTLTLEDARQRVLANSKLLALAALNAEGKTYATKAARADYFPKIIGTALYFHFDNPLGNVLEPGPRGLISMPVSVNVLNQDSSFSTVAAAQPITALLKVRQGVKIARADEQIAQAQLEKGTRELLAGVEQLYWGLLAAQRIRAGTLVAVGGAELLAKTKTIEARTALLEARQGLQAVDSQIADVQAQLNALLDLPACTKLELAEPPLPVLPLNCADEAVSLALSASPEIREAEQDVVKAHAAVAAAKVDYLPNVLAVGGFAKQTGANYIQQDINYVALTGSYTFFEWGKRKNTVRERENLVALAQLKVRQTEDEVRQKALKAFREFDEKRVALHNAEEMVQLRKEAEEKAAAPVAKFAAAKERMLAEVEAVKADLAYRVAHVQLMSLLGKP